MEFDKNIRNTKKYYNKIKRKDKKSCFEEKYIRLFETEDYSEYLEALDNSKYKDAIDISMILLPESISLTFNHGDINFYLDFTTECLEVSITNEEDPMVDIYFDEEYKINYSLSNYDLVESALAKLGDGVNYVMDRNRALSYKNEFFGVNNIKEKSKDVLKNSFIYGLILLLASVGALVYSCFIFIKGDTSNYLVFIILAFISIYAFYLGYQFITRFITVYHHVKKIVKHDEEKETSGKATKVKFFVDKSSAKTLDYVLLKVNGLSLLACIPDYIYYSRKTLAKLKKTLLTTNLEITYYKSSNIIDLKKSNVYLLIVDANKED